MQGLPPNSGMQFCERLFKFINEHEVEKLVIDLSNNHGGNGNLNLQFLHAPYRTQAQPAGKPFVIVSRRTFSAAMGLSIDRPHNAILVGEPALSFFRCSKLFQETIRDWGF